MLDARSKERFPSLAPPSCPWHDDCTPMDCENFRTIRNILPLPTLKIQTLKPKEEQ